MSIETLMSLRERDLTLLAEGYEKKAAELRQWVKDKGYPDAAVSIFEKEAEGYLLLARMYRRMANDTLTFIETYEDGGDGDNGN